MTDALSLLGLPSAVIGASKQVLAANPQFESLAPRIRIAARDLLAIDDRASGKLVDDALAGLAGGVGPRVQSIPVLSNGSEPPLILHLLPVRRAAQDIFSRGCAIVVVTEIGTAGPPDLRVLAGLFDMTPTEVRIARDIAVGKSIEQIAASGGNSIETVRTHLKRIMSKTGTRRQGQLVHLLLGLTTPLAKRGDLA